MANRSESLRAFVADALHGQAFTLAPASADASFRSYWRVRAGADSWIVMDAPPDKEDLAPWLDIGARLHAAGLHTPAVFAVDRARGFVLMEDLGTRTYLPELTATSADTLYAGALDALLTMQTRVASDDLPPFDAAFLRMELELMPHWFLQRHLGRAELSGAEGEVVDSAFALLIESALAQPQCFMHRDYHSRNLMIAAQDNPGIIDFQGALHGPIAYDLASLLRDCYIAWPGERVDAWVEQYRQRLQAAGAMHADAMQFRRWFDLIGLQRHLKVLGIFCRLCYRDGKPAYLADLPLVLEYVLGVARGYPELVDFAALLQNAVGGRDLTRPRADKAAVP